MSSNFLEKLTQTSQVCENIDPNSTFDQMVQTDPASDVDEYFSEILKNPQNPKTVENTEAKPFSVNKSVPLPDFTKLSSSLTNFEFMLNDFSRKLILLEVDLKLLSYDIKISKRMAETPLNYTKEPYNSSESRNIFESLKRKDEMLQTETDRKDVIVQVEQNDIDSFGKGRKKGVSFTPETMFEVHPRSAPPTPYVQDFSIGQKRSNQTYSSSPEHRNHHDHHYPSTDRIYSYDYDVPYSRGTLLHCDHCGRPDPCGRIRHLGDYDGYVCRSCNYNFKESLRKTHY
jgi:hypothetical protein